MSSLTRPAFHILLFLSGLLARGGLPRIRRLARLLGAFMWAILPARRRLATTTVAERLEVPETQAEKIARESFVQNAMSFLEMTMVPQFGLQHASLQIAEPEQFERVRHSGRPIVCTTAHLGAWELSAGLAGDFLPPPLPCMIVVRSHGNAVFRDYMFAMRGSRGSHIVGHRNATYTVLKGLRKKGLVGFLVDHNCSRDEAIFMQFLGKTAAVNVGPAILAVRTQALVWPLCVIRENSQYTLITDEPLDTTLLEGNHEQRVASVASFYTQAVEKRIRQYPEQWFWMHKRWKTRPPSEEA